MVNINYIFVIYSKTLLSHIHPCITYSDIDSVLNYLPCLKTKTESCPAIDKIIITAPPECGIRHIF